MEEYVPDLEWFGFILMQLLNLNFSWVWPSLSAEPPLGVPKGFRLGVDFPWVPLAPVRPSRGFRATGMNDLRGADNGDRREEALCGNVRQTWFMLCCLVLLGFLHGSFPFSPLYLLGWLRTS